MEPFPSGDGNVTHVTHTTGSCNWGFSPVITEMSWVLITHSWVVMCQGQSYSPQWRSALSMPHCPKLLIILPYYLWGKVVSGGTGQWPALSALRAGSGLPAVCWLQSSIQAGKWPKGRVKAFPYLWVNILRAQILSQEDGTALERQL